MRAFIAIELPPELKDKITKLISELQSAEFCDAKWVSEQQLHLTLKFLGEIKREDVTKVEFVLKEIASHAKSFPLQLAEIGHFNQRVLWIGGNSGQDEMIKLANKIDAELHKLGFAKEEREFSVHLTLARIKYVKDKAKFQQVLEKYKKADFGKFKANKIKLIESVLSAEGPVYKTVAEFTFLL